MEPKICGITITPTGVAVDIEKFGEWGLSHADIATLRGGDHLLPGTWPEHERWCDAAWMEEADHIVSDLIEDALEVAKVESVRDALEEVPGRAREVWGGWIWVVGSNEQRWSKRPTRAECEQVVAEVVERLGVEDAFDLFVDEEEQT